MKRDRSHYIAQLEGKIRDNYTCQVCGSREGVQGHHVFDYQYGGEADVDNIVALCQECHKRAHRGEINLIVSS